MASTSLPVDVQDEILSAIPALKNAHVLRYGYAVEYDVVDPSQLDHRLGSPRYPGFIWPVKLMAHRAMKKLACKVCWPVPTQL